MAAALGTWACGDGGGTGPGETGGFAGPPVGMAACTTAPILTTSPVPIASLQYVVPLGNLNPGGHTFPSDHIYLLVVKNGASPPPTTVVSPGDVRITGVASSSVQQNGTTVTDYSLYFYGCADVEFYYHHIQTLDAALAAKVGSIGGADCSTYSTGGGTYTRCNKTTDIAMLAGDAIGNVGGTGSFSFDLGAYDRRTARLGFVNQAFPDFGGGMFNTFHTVCPLDYFTASVKASLEAKLGNHTGLRTVAPVCGEIMYDVANTASGRWFFGASQQEDPHLALVRDNVDPSIASISIGTSVPSIPLGVYRFTWISTPQPRINNDFRIVFPATGIDPRIHCYEGFIGNGANLHVLMQLTTSTTLKIEGFSGSTCGSSATWAFTSAAVTFNR